MLIFALIVYSFYCTSARKSFDEERFPSPATVSLFTPGAGERFHLGSGE